ncbi:MAG: carbohydrate ABC transporter permease [Candidatus Bipolaricaulota bacterium]
MNAFKRSVIYATLFVYSGLILFPLYMMYSASFRETRDIFQKPLAFPTQFNLSNYVDVLAETNFLLYLTNSVLITGVSILASLLLGTLAAYALARYSFVISGPLYVVFLFGLIVPLRLASVPLFLLMRNLGLLDTRIALITIYTAWRLGFTILIMHGFFSSLPVELEDAGRIDGCNEFSLFYRVMLPLAKPGLVIAAIYNAVPVWNDFFFPLVFTTSERVATLPLAVSQFFGERSAQWGPLFAFLGLAVLPIIALYLVMSRKFIEGMLAGAMD